MLVKELLDGALEKCLVAVPAGRSVLEIAEILLGQELPPTTTGRELNELLKAVEQPLLDRFLNHSLDDTIGSYKDWARLTESKPFRSSLRVLDITILCVVLWSTFAGGMFAFEYFKSGAIPTYEQLSVTFPPLLAVLIVQYGLNDNELLSMLFKLFIRRRP